MKKAKRIFRLVGLGIIFYLSLQTMTVQIAILIDSLGSLSPSQADAIGLYEARFSEVKNNLRNGPTTIGYLSCPELDEESNTYHYFLTQYVLTPIIIEDTLEHEIILGNFPPELCDINDFNREKNNLSLYQEFGNGIFLLEKNH